ncbi:putative lipid kinase YegS-like protein [Vibrio inusitatus NBRC 102082]|uniref:Putative lipid kinase YegS-like protein n=1 Tax=Vibrio inusitatus NBRC 102082 TaxID=1219070 RepID=A0A4Y3HYN9_9VIBR|nr:lipid kinase YegS [Vibrio inusitatus]GEA52227.1 putative lipid kinase YegS-like protein [Vibrio inusitatus NBRC 102082]
MVKNVIRLILNGKKAGLESVREAVYAIREKGYDLQVRSTWEEGDVDRLVREAAKQGVTRIVAGGGDGTVNEVVSALLKHNLNHIELSVLPLGTANDFATACEIPIEPFDALNLAVSGQSYWVDAGSANEHFFMNVATAGFGAQVTATTPVVLKNFLGGGAYTLSGLVQAINFQPFPGTVIHDDKVKLANVVVGAVCNGRTAGGGQPLAPKAYIDDGVFDLFFIEGFNTSDIPTVLEELQELQKGPDTQFVHRHSIRTIEWHSEESMPINLDGEPMSPQNVVIKVLPSSIKLVLPEHTPVLLKWNKA